MVVDVSKLASGWVEFVKKTNPNTGSIPLEDYINSGGGDDWAVNDLFDLMYSDVSSALDVVYEISQCEDDWVIENLGSGPLETLLGHYTDIVMVAMEEKGITEGIKRALSYVWDESFPHNVREFVRKYST